MRVVVLNQSDPLRQVVQFISERGYDIDIVAETDFESKLLPLVNSERPDYLFLLKEDYAHISSQIPKLLDAYPDLGIALVSDNEQQVHLYKAGFVKDQSCRPAGETLGEEHWLHYSLSDFVSLMTEDSPREVPPGGITAVERDQP